MPRESDPLLEWLRATIDRRGLRTADLAKETGIQRARLRRILIGTEDMFVHELTKISRVLDLRPSDIAGVDLDGAPPPEKDAMPPAPAIGPDPWGNHPEQLFKMAFGLGCDVLFTAETAQLQGSGLPAYVLEKYKGAYVPIDLQAEFHSYNAPRYEEEGFRVTLSFDALYECFFPWSSIHRMVFSPALDVEEPAPPPQATSPRPHLRLVE